MPINPGEQIARAKFIDTVAPYPFQEAMTFGAAAEKRIAQNMGALGNAEAAIQKLRGIPNTLDAKRANDIVNRVTQLVNDYASKDLMDPYIAAKFKRDYQTVADPEEIRAISESRQNWEKGQVVKQQLMARGLYNEALDIWDPARNPNFYSKTNGTYTYMPRAATDPNKWANEVFSFTANKGRYKGTAKNPKTGLPYDIWGFDASDAAKYIEEDLPNLASQQATKDIMTTMLYSHGYTPDQISHIINNPMKYKKLYSTYLSGLADRFTWDTAKQVSMPEPPKPGGTNTDKPITDQAYAWSMNPNASKEQLEQLNKKPVVVANTLDKKYEAQKTQSTNTAEINFERLRETDDNYANVANEKEAMNIIRGKIASHDDLSPAEERFMHSVYSYNNAANKQLSLNSARKNVEDINRTSLSAAYDNPEISLDGKTVNQRVDSNFDKLLDIYVRGTKGLDIGKGVGLVPKEYNNILSGKEVIDAALSYFKNNSPKWDSKTYRENFPEKTQYQIGEEIARMVWGDEKMDKLSKDKLAYGTLISGIADVAKTLYDTDIKPTVEGWSKLVGADQISGASMSEAIKKVDSDPMIILQNYRDFYPDNSTKYSPLNSGDSFTSMMFNLFDANVGNNDLNVSVWNKYNPNYSSKNSITKVQDEMRNNERVIIKDQPLKFKVDTQTGDLTALVETVKLASDPNSTSKKLIPQPGSYVTLPIRISRNGKNGQANNAYNLIIETLRKKGGPNPKSPDNVLATQLEMMPSLVQDMMSSVNYVPTDGKPGEEWVKNLTTVDQTGNVIPFSTLKIRYNEKTNRFEFVEQMASTGEENILNAGILEDIVNFGAKYIIDLIIGAQYNNYLEQNKGLYQ